MSKNLKYYLSLHYTVEIRKLSKENGGGYLASIPQLGSKAFCADGKTIEEALSNLNRIKEDLFRDYLNRGVLIPEPEVETETIFSGKFVVRIPTTLHRELVETARKQDVSLNQYVLHLLSYNTPLVALEQKVEECFGEIKSTLSSIDVAFRISPEPVYDWGERKDSYAEVA